MTQGTSLHVLLLFRAFPATQAGNGWFCPSRYFYAPCVYGERHDHCTGKLKSAGGSSVVVSDFSS